jgi:hypothetical protein
MIAPLLLIGSLLIVAVLCVRLMRQTRYQSLLAWTALIFAAVFGPAALFLEPIMNRDRTIPFPVRFDSVSAERILTSVILTNLVLIVFLFVVQRKASSRDFSDLTSFAWTKVPVFLPLGLIFAVAAFLAIVFSPGGTFRMEHGLLDVFGGLGNYDAYYDLRFGVQQIGWSSTLNTFYGMAYLLVVPLLTAYALQRFLLSKRSRWLIIWIAILLLWVIFALFNLQKAPFIQIAVTNLVVWLFCVRHRGMRRGRLVLLVIVAFVLLLIVLQFVYGVTHGSEGIAAVLGEVFERVFYGPIDTTFAHFVIFPDAHPFLNWSGSTTLHYLLAPWTDRVSTPLSAYELTAWYVTGTAFNMDTGFVGDGWAQLGFLGILQGALIIFGMYLFWDLHFLRAKQFIPLYALIAYFIGNSSVLLETSLMSELLFGGAILAPIFYLALFNKKLQLRAVPDH